MYNIEYGRRRYLRSTDKVYIDNNKRRSCILFISIGQMSRSHGVKKS